MRIMAAIVWILAPIGVLDAWSRSASNWLMFCVGLFFFGFLLDGLGQCVELLTALAKHARTDKRDAAD